MPNGIIYIARNDSNPTDHYKIGKSDRADPSYRMRELTSDTTNYQGEFLSKGYVLVSEVDECERLVHQTLDDVRINDRREFFEINLSEAIKVIRQTLRSNIIEDFFEEEFDISDKSNNIQLLSGDKDQYKNQRHILNFIEPSEIQSLSFKEICKFADVHEWGWNLSCHGGGCLWQFRHAFYILLNKAKFIQKFSEDPNYIPRESQTMYSRQDIPRNKAILLQKLILKINIQDYLRDVKFPNNLGYLGVAVHMIGEDLERENKKLTKFLISEFTRLYSNQTNTIRRLDEIYYNGDILNYSKLEIFEKMINNNNIERLRV